MNRTHVARAAGGRRSYSRLRAAIGLLAASAMAVAGTTAQPEAPAAQAAGVSTAPVRPAITKAKLKSAKVPAMCSNPAGRMRNGKLVNGEGGQFLRSNRIAIGTTKPGSKKGAAAAVVCAYPWTGGRGTVSEHVVFWDASGRVIGNYSEGKLGSAPDTRKIWIKGKTTYVQVRNYTRDAECMVCGTGEALLQFRWSKAKKRMVLVKVSRYSEASAATKLATAIVKGKTSTAGKYATKSVVGRLKSMRGAKATSFCYGSWETTNRVCQINFTKGGRLYYSTVEFKHLGWRSWRAVKASGLAWAGYS